MHVVFFFSSRRRHTRCLSDWSSDVCSSDLGMVSAPLRSRFGMTARLDYYNAEEMQKIIVRSSQLLGVEIDAAGAAQIAARSRGTPRTANNLRRWGRDYGQGKAEGEITADLPRRALHRSKNSPP